MLSEKNKKREYFRNKFGKFWPCRVGLQNTPTAFLQRVKIPPTGVLDITLNNLMVRLQ